METGNITLDESYVSVHADVAPGEYVMIAITDTGNGMNDEVKTRLFEPFFTTKLQGEGTGLGLSMCYGIAKQLGGHISVYSEQGQGTTFKIFLPRLADAQLNTTVGSRPDSDKRPERGTETLLLVEDDAGLRDLATVVLERLGYNVHTAANGREAMSLAERFGQIDLLLTDVVMPQMSGRELAERLRALQPSLKVLYTSAYTEEAVVHNGILAAGIDFLRKPYTPSSLAQKARASLDGGIGSEGQNAAA